MEQHFTLVNDLCSMLGCAFGQMRRVINFSTTGGVHRSTEGPGPRENGGLESAHRAEAGQKVSTSLL